MESQLPSASGEGVAILPAHNRNGRVPPTTSSPHLVRRPASANSSPHLVRRQTSTSHDQHLSRVICNSLWRQKLTFHPYVSGDAPVAFCSLWPDKSTLVDTYREAEFHKRPYELCKLLLSTNSYKALDGLLDEKVNVYSGTFNKGPSERRTQY